MMAVVPATGPTAQEAETSPYASLSQEPGSSSSRSSLMNAGVAVRGASEGLPKAKRAGLRLAASSRGAYVRLETAAAGEGGSEGLPQGEAAAGAAGDEWASDAGVAACLGGLYAECDDRSRTTALVNAAAIMERVDEQLLPALYRFVGGSFQATPSQLGLLTLSRALVQALASPLAGVLGHYFNRIALLAAGAALWGTMTALFSFCTSVSQGIPLWACNGVGLSLLLPTAQSLIADYNVPAHRGKAFGLLFFTGALGALISALGATNIGAKHPFGLEGWRFAFLAVAAASWVIGTLTWHFGMDPRYTADERVEKAGDVATASVRGTLAEIWSVVSIPSFLIIVLQGIVGSTPWNALVFITFWFQLVGFSDLQASILLAAFLAANAAGGLLGGFLGDWAAARWPNHGRILVCQFSVSVGVPGAVLLFKGLPLHPGGGAMAAYLVVLVLGGLLVTWPAPACNNPIFSEIVPGHLRALIYSFDRSFEGAIAACGAPLVGWLAERAFGFQGAAETSLDVQANLAKARSLGSALVVFTALPWTLCGIFYTGLHWTYPRDKRWAEEEVRLAHPISLELPAVESPFAVTPEESPRGWAVGRRAGDKGELQPLPPEDSALV